MILLRSLAYQVVFVLWTLVLGVLFLPLLAGRRLWAQRAARLWARGVLLLQRHLLALDFEVRGVENLPRGPAVFASKHQSAWETLVFHHLLDDPAFILKRSLLALPFIGFYLWKSGQIAIDRKGGAKALAALMQAARRAIAEGRQIVIFPEGHRQPPGVTGEYHPGVMLLYRDLEAPLIPVALDSGLYWGRNAFLRRPGRIVLEFLPAVPRGLDRRTFMRTLRERIEGATRALEAEARRRDPRLPAGISTPVDKFVEE